MFKIEREENERNGRFVIYEDGVYAGEMAYVWAGKNKFIISHTGVEETFAGKGYGKLLVLDAVKFARENGVKILPLCPFAKSEFDKNDDFNDVKL